MYTVQFGAFKFTGNLSFLYLFYESVRIDDLVKIKNSEIQKEIRMISYFLQIVFYFTLVRK